MNQLANIVTFSRAPMGVAIAIIIQNPTPKNIMICLILAILAEITDFADGTIARATNSVSELGKSLDPLCDSLYRLSVFVGFAHLGWMFFPVVFVFLFRDIIVAYSRIFAAQAGFEVSARISGKLKAIFQGVAIIGSLALMLFAPETHAETAMLVSQILLYIAALVTFYSAFDYALNMQKS